ncbi:MAG: leucyl aminopeptidase [Candidatus Krumholzibacteriia bacterium]
MINRIVRVKPEFTGKEDVVVLPLHSGDKKPAGAARKLDVLCRSAISRTLGSGHFKGEPGETLLLALHLPKAPDHVLLLGLGPTRAANPERMARAGGAASRVLKKHRFTTVHLLAADALEDAPDERLHPFLKGFLLAQYRFFLGQTNTKAVGIKRLELMAGDGKAVSNAIRRARMVSEHNEKVRDLVNLPANVLTPLRLAAEARTLAKDHGLTCRILGRRELEKMKMGAVLGVAQGSNEEPRFICLHYNKGKSTRGRVCLVGKAVTFDTGGISIKPWQHMDEMKGDMAGGALVLSVIGAAARMKLPLEIIALVPAVENMPSGNAFRPGDVITTYSGKTIEVLSTDAEGRLILSDALAYATEFKPDLIVDFATLTGAVVVALGTHIAGVMGNSQSHIDRLIDAGAMAGEQVWQLPLDEFFSESVKGEISDYKNYSGRDGSTITAAALLREFVGKTPWVHVDIAGTFWSDSGKVPYHAKGATGYGVDLALRFLQSLAERK